jgi:hypothetical protein
MRAELHAMVSGWSRVILLVAIFGIGCRTQEPGPMTAKSHAASVLITTAKQPLYLATDGSFVYWTDSGCALLKLPTEGGTPVLLASVERGIDACFGRLVLDESEVYFIESGERNDGEPIWAGRDDGERILAVPKRGGVVRVLASRRSSPSSLAVDAEYAYWVDGGPHDEEYSGGLQVLRVPKAGGRSVVIASMAESAPENTDIVVDDEVVYWIDDQGLFRVPKAGGRPKLLWRGEEEDISGHPEYWGGEVLRGLDRDLYVVTTVGTIETIPKEGGHAVQLVDQFEDGGEISGLAVERWKLYWTSFEVVRRAGIDGGNRTKLASSTELQGPIIVDKTHVYWIDAGRHAIMSMSKNE